MDTFRSVYYLCVSMFCAVALSTLCIMRLDEDKSFGDLFATRSAQHSEQQAIDTTVVIKKPPQLLYLSSHSVVACTTRKDAKQLAKIFADAGTDLVKSGVAYDAYWKNSNCDVYSNGVSLVPTQVQVAYVTKQISPVKVYLGEEGKVAANVFQPNLYIVMMPVEVFENIFQCIHDVDEESGYDAIESCRPHV